MKLLRDEMDKRWSLVNEFSLNKESLKEVWCFYSLYDLSLAVCKMQDLDYSKKNYLVKKLVENPTDLNVYNKIRSFMAKDIRVINLAMDIIEDVKEGGVQTGDYKKHTMFAISINE